MQPTCLYNVFRMTLNVNLCQGESALQLEGMNVKNPKYTFVLFVKNKPHISKEYWEHRTKSRTRKDTSTINTGYRTATDCYRFSNKHPSHLLPF